MKKQISSTLILGKYRAVRHVGCDAWTIYPEDSAETLFTWPATTNLTKPIDIAVLQLAIGVYESGVFYGINLGKKAKSAEIKRVLGIVEQPDPI